MKKILTILIITAVWPASFVAGQTKQDSGSVQATSQGTEVNWLDAPTPDGSPTLRETSDWLAKTLTVYGVSRGPNDTVSEGTWGKVTVRVNGTSRIVGAHIDGQCHFIYNEIDAEGTRVLNKHEHENVSYTGITVSVPLGVPGLVIANDADDGYPIKIQTGSTHDIAVTSAALDAKNFRINDNYPEILVLREATWPAGTTSYTNVVEPAVEVNPPDSSQAGSQVRVSAFEMRPRIISALQHAAALCGSIYQAPTQKREPF